MLGLKEIDTINSSDIYDTYKDLYLSKKEREEKFLQGIQSVNCLKTRVGAKKADGTALTASTQENGIKKMHGLLYIHGRTFCIFRLFSFLLF